MIIGFHFTKMLVERQGAPKGKVSISNGIDITNVTEHPYTLREDKKAINFHFAFNVQYKTDVGNIALDGDVLCLVDKARSKQVLNLWKTKKKIPSEESMLVINTVLGKCNIKALELSQELNLPPHVPLPKVTFDKKNLAETYIG